MADRLTRTTFTQDDPMPGIERKRSPGESFPMLIGEAMQGLGNERPMFAFQSWAASVGFVYPEAALSLLRACGSAAEAYFVREFIVRDGVTFHGLSADWQGDRLEIQVKARGYRMDAVVSRSDFRLAVEIDGMAFHHRSAKQVADDYLRQRRIVCQGYTVIRFTAPEVFGNAAECWRQVDLILEANS